MRLYSDLDLVDGRGAAHRRARTACRPPGFAAALSALVFEARRPDDDAPRVPGGATREAIDELGPVWPVACTRWRSSTASTSPAQPDLGFAWATYRWAEGDDLDEVLSGASGLACRGDFVRWIKQVIDLAGQVADAAGAGPVRDDRAGRRTRAAPGRRGLHRRAD